MKIVQISSCGECPHLYENRQYFGLLEMPKDVGYKCSLLDEVILSFSVVQTELDKIYKDCPLEDA